ncbi:MAG: hypothetical protein K0R27_281 [Xanthobacteraceae bacterium]|jgi:uncharacterized membrane protein YhaH (DUF805 family)|nr:hypothetical protein [Xanthobacteraceae bacterium]
MFDSPARVDEEVAGAPSFGWYVAFALFLFPSVIAMITAIGKRANDIGWPRSLVLLVLFMPVISGYLILVTGRAAEVTPVIYLTFAWMFYLALVPSMQGEEDAELGLPAVGGSEAGDPPS